MERFGCREGRVLGGEEESGVVEAQGCLGGDGLHEPRQ